MSSQPLLETYGKEKEDRTIVIKEVGAEEDVSVSGEEVKVRIPPTSSDFEIGREGEVDSAQSSCFVIRWGRRTLVDPFLVILRRGLKPKQLATSAALGITLGIFPVYGVTVVLSAIVATLLRSNCNLPTLMLGNLVATPLELGLIVPFLRLGEWVCGGDHFLLTPNALWLAITGQASHAVLFGLIHALLGWAIIAPPLFGGLYVIFYPVFWCLIQKFGGNRMVHITTPVSPQVMKPEFSSFPPKDLEI